jgi:hypothetical protein
MQNLTINTVTSGLSFEQLARFAIEWANDPAADGQSVARWVEQIEGSQWQELDWGDTFLCWDPKTFPKNGQAKLKTWLDHALTGKLPPAVLADLTRHVKQIQGTFGVEWIAERGPVMLPRMTGSPPQIAALGVMALAGPELQEGFGKCEWCERYFLERAKRSGPPRRFCPDRGCDNAARQNRFRGGTGKRKGMVV